MMCPGMKCNMTPLLLDFKLPKTPTNRNVPKLDIVVVYKLQKKAAATDVGILSDSNIKKNEHNNLE